jgi:ferric-dicitrate binding protein FerR (iron transport regulator)
MLLTSRIPAVLFLLIVLLAFASCSKVKVETKDNFEVVDLPDGSQVYLNRNTSVSYDKNFNPRTIEVKGEAFFSVVSGENPFVVQTSQGEVTVVGTEFDVKSEAEELEVEVEEGVVDLKTKHDNSQVKEGEMAVYNESKGAIQKGKSEFKSSAWLDELRQDFKKLGKEVKKGGKQVGKEFKKGGKVVGKEFKKTGNELKKALK